MLPIPPGDDDGRMTSRDFPLYVEFKTEVEKTWKDDKKLNKKELWSRPPQRRIDN